MLKLPVRLLLSAAAVAAALAAVQSQEASLGPMVPAAGAGTPVCGSVSADTTWNAAGSPYTLCDAGVAVTSGTLTLDGSQGPVAVVAAGRGGLRVDRGFVRTAATTPENRVTFDALVAAPGAWAGITAAPTGLTDGPPAVVAAHVTIRNAVTGFASLGGVDAELRHVTVEHSSGTGITARFGSLTLEDSLVRESGAEGMQLQHNAAKIRRVRVDGAGAEGISLHPASGPLLQDSTITRSGRTSPQPALRVQGRFSLDTPTGVQVTTGADNGVNAAVIGGAISAPFVWRTATVAPDVTAPQPLGYLNLGIQVGGTGTLVVPSGAVVKSGGGGNENPNFFIPDEPNSGMIVVGGPTLDVHPGAVFTSLSDDSAGLSSCGVLAASCTPAAGDWLGVVTERDVQMSGASLRYARTALRARASTTSFSGTTTRLTDVSVRHVEQGLVVGDSVLTRVHVEGTRKIGGLGTQAIDIHGSSRLEDVSAADTVFHAIEARPSRPTSTFQARGVRVRDSGGSGLRLRNDVTGGGYRSPVVQDVSVVRSGTFAPGAAAAVDIGGVDLRVGPGRDIDGIGGVDNGLNALNLRGSVSGGLTWRALDVERATSPQPFGYVVKDDQLTLNGGRLVIAPGAVVKAGGLRLSGAALDTSAGTVTFVPPNNAAYEPRSCAAVECGKVAAGADPAWGGPLFTLSVTADVNGVPSSANLVGARVVDAHALTVTGGSTLAIRGSDVQGQTPLAKDSRFVPVPRIAADGGALVIDRSVVRGVGVTANLSETTITGTTLTEAPESAVRVTGGGTTRLEEVLVDRPGFNGVIAIRSRVDMSRTRIVAGAGEFSGGVNLHDGATVVGRCNSVRDSGLVTFRSTDSPSQLTDSDLYGGRRAPEVVLGAALDARRSWWGQAGGPRSDQVDRPDRLDASDPAAAQAPSAQMSLTGAQESSGSYGSGPLAVSLAFSRVMDRDVEPVVTITGGDGVPHRVGGAWQTETSWSGTYELSSSSVARGDNRVEARDARGCVFDAQTNRMTPAAQEFRTSTGYDAPSASPSPAASPSPSGTSSPSPAASPTPTPTPTPTPSATASPSPAPTPVGTGGTASPSPETPPAGQAFSPLVPARVLDTRDGTGGVSGRLPNGRAVSLRVTGRGGVPSSGVSAVVLNMTVTGPSASGFLTVFPGDASVPLASNLNFVRGQTVPNLVVVPVAADGTVRLLANAGGPHVIADVVGWYGQQATERFSPLVPARVLDTRDGTGGVSGRLPNGRAVSLRVTGRGGVPSSGVSAVVLNMTVTGPSASGFLTVFPGDASVPLASNLNFVRGQTVPNLVVVPVAADGTVRLLANAGGPHVIADVVGWFGAG